MIEEGGEGGRMRLKEKEEGTLGRMEGDGVPQPPPSATSPACGDGGCGGTACWSVAGVAPTLLLLLLLLAQGR